MRLFLVALPLAILGCNAEDRSGIQASTTTDFDSASLALATRPSDAPQDHRVQSLQAEIHELGASAERFERLGWAFVTRARSSYDPGDYKLAEHAALASLSLAPGRADTRLLQGHVLHALHRFEEAERVANALVADRGIAADWSLLGDVRLDRGDVEEAARAYQRMMDQRPDAQAFNRAAELRWTVGDVEGAAQMMLEAVRATPPRDAHAYAWMRARLAAFLFQLGHMEAAHALVESALAKAPASAEALYQKGRLLLAGLDPAAAIPPLEAAARISPLPSHLQALAEAYRSARDSERAERALSRLYATGSGIDPRGLALVLASTGHDAPRAVELAERELDARSDAQTLDVAAWAHARMGDLEPAWEAAERALAFGSRDARLWLHAGIIAARRGDHENARVLLNRAQGLSYTLLPSEKKELTGFTETWEW